MLNPKSETPARRDRRPLPEKEGHTVAAARCLGSAGAALDMTKGVAGAALDIPNGDLGAAARFRSLVLGALDWFGISSFVLRASRLAGLERRILPCRTVSVRREGRKLVGSETGQPPQPCLCSHIIDGSPFPASAFSMNLVCKVFDTPAAAARFTRSRRDIRWQILSTKLTRVSKQTGSNASPRETQTNV